MTDEETPIEEQSEHYVTVATKISTTSYKTLQRISGILGMTVYEILQMLLAAFIRLRDPGCVITDEMNRLRIAFEQDTKQDSRLQLTDPSARPTVKEATYFLGDATKKGMRLVHVSDPGTICAEQTENVNDILERTMCEINPVLYKKIRMTMVQLNCTSVLDFLLKVVMETEGMEDVNAFEELFADVRKNDFGKELADAPYRRTMTNSMDSFERKDGRHFVQTEINFE